MPISELDIWRSAKLLVDQHGADAPIRAAQRADKLLAAGDIEGRAVGADWAGRACPPAESRRKRHGSVTLS